MINFDYHMHTVYCDGKSTVEEIVRSAISKGMSHIGFSGHSYTSFDERYCMTKENTKKYIEEINEYKKIYGDRIKIYCGIERDYYADDFMTDSFDYTIGSVHYVKAGDKYFDVDDSAMVLKDTVNQYFDGDYYKYISLYYEQIGAIADVFKPDIIGHFDLVTKFNEGNLMFDTNNPKYICAWQKAADKLIEYNIPFEINTGAISRGYRTEPYPSREIIDYIASKGGRFILSSDSHHKDTLCYWFDKLEKEPPYNKLNIVNIF